MFWCAVWTVARGRGWDIGNIDVLHLRGQLDQFQQHGVTQPVEDELSLASSQQDARIAHCHEMLGNISLAPAQKSLQMTNTGLFVANREQNRKPCWMSDLFQYGRDFLGLAHGFHIQDPEYIVGERKTTVKGLASSKVHDEHHNCSASHPLIFVSIKSRT